MSLTNPNSVVTKQTLSDLYQTILPYLAGEEKEDIIYGFHIDGSESVPSDKVTYLLDAVGMTPAFMDYENDMFDYGSWGNAFFMPKPCMLKYDGTVDYYLDPNDYTKKIDGTASDISDTTYGGNAMMEWGQNGKKIWLKIEPDESDNRSANIYIANYKADNDFTDWPFHNSLGQSVDHFYTAIYNGSYTDGVKRSLSGVQVDRGNTAAKDIEFAMANNKTQDVIWNIEVISDITLITCLIILIGKSTNTQEVFGQGLTVSGSGQSEANMKNYRFGAHNDKGLFYGTNSGDATISSNCVKVFGMENWWGLQWRRYLGEVIINGSRKIKLTYGTEDGSTTTGYNLTGEGYINSNVPSPSGGDDYFIVGCVFTNQGIFPTYTSSSGSSSTYYCDYMRYSNSKTAIPFRGSHTYNETDSGAFSIKYNETASQSYWYYGAALSAKPLS